ncbi:MAG: hypothetical protein AAF756_16925 [Pseudomonadota bacterium]
MTLKTVAILLIAFAAGLLVRDQLPEQEAVSDSPIVTNETLKQIAGKGLPPSPERPTPNAAPMGFAALAEQSTIFDVLHAAYALAASAGIEQSKAYLKASLVIDDPLFSANVADVFLERLSALDVSESVTFIEGLPEGKGQRRLMISVLTTWARIDGDAALNYLADIEDVQFRRLAANVISTDAGLPDPVITAAQEVLTAAIVELRGDSALLAKSVSLNNAQVTEDIAAIEKRVTADPDGTLDELMAMPRSRQKEMLTTAALGKLAIKDPERAIAFLTEFPEELASAENQVFTVIARTAPERFKAEIEEHARRTGDFRATGDMITAMMRTDKDAAVEYFESLNERARSRLGDQIVALLIKDDPYEGLKWALEHEQGDHLMFSMMTNSNPQIVVQADILMAELPTDSSDRADLMVALSTHHSRDDPRKALTWLDRYRGDLGYDRAYVDILNRWASDDPAAAAAQLASDPPASDGGHVYNMLAHYWGRSDPDAAESWAFGLRDERMRELALGSLISQYASTQEQRARSLYSKLPKGLARDKAGAMLAMQIAGDNPSEWREAMEDLGVSEEVIESFLIAWTP